MKRIRENLWKSVGKTSPTESGGKRFKVQGARANGTIVLQLLELPETP